MKDNNRFAERSVPVTDAKTGETRVVAMPSGRRDERLPPTTSVDTAEIPSIVDAPKEPSNSSKPRVVEVPAAEATSAAQDGSTNTEKPAKPADPQDLADYLAAVYAGRLKSLPEALAKRLRNAEVLFDPMRRGELLRDAQNLDTSLDKTRLLMQLARRPQVFPRLAREIREFARAAVKQHPLARLLEDPSQLMPGFNDGTTSEALWAELTSEHLSGPLAGTDATDNATGAKSSESVKSKPGSQRTNINARICNNIFWCDIFWRRSEGHLSFTETMRVLRVTVFSLPALSDTSDDDTIEALSALAEKEDKRTALLFDWGHRTSTVAFEKVLHLERQLEIYKAQIDEAAERERVLQASLEAAETEAAQKDHALKAALDETAVQKVHARADYEHLRADALGVIRAAVDELNNVDVALSREVPKTAFVRDVVHSVVDSLTRHIKSLEDKK